MVLFSVESSVKLNPEMSAAGLVPALSTSLNPMTNRYFMETSISDSQVTLTGSEAHHLAHVMRASPGDRVTLFDGSGAEFTAEVDRLERRQARLTVVDRHEVDRELPLRITLAVALPKGDRQKWLVEKAVELGVAELVPLVSERSVARPREQSLVRLGRTVVEASKQCGRNRLMQISQPRAWSDFVAETADVCCRLLAHPGGEAPAGREGEAPAEPMFRDNSRLSRSFALPFQTKPNVYEDIRSANLDRVVAAIGPEGGFSHEEIALAVAAGWRKIGLGRRILRVETAALLLTGIISAAFLE